MTHCHQTTGSLGPQSTSIKGCWEKLVSTPPACEIMSGFQIQICLVFKKGHMITLSQFQFQKCKGEPRSLCCVLFTSAMTAVMRWRRCALLEITSIAFKRFCCLFAYMTLFSLYHQHDDDDHVSIAIIAIIIIIIIKLIVMIIVTIIILIITETDLLGPKELLWNEKRVGRVEGRRHLCPGLTSRLT